MNKKKGQGALEYLLLIGGAVLIAVIVIALLVGMGGQSRETAQDQATKASKTLDQPQPASIVSVTPDNSAAFACGDGAGGYVTFNWQKLSEGGTYTIKVYDYSNAEETTQFTVGGTDVTLDNNSATATTYVFFTDPAEKCENTYWLEITTTKNGQSVKSTRMKFNWT